MTERKLCPKCNGRGEYFFDDHCQGTWVEYVYPLTEQEWIQTATTEQLAEWIAHQTMIALLENQNNHSLRMTYPAYWVEWLKQPHTPKE